MNKIISLILIFTINLSFSQSKILIKQVDKLIFSNNSFRMFKKVKNNEYKEVFLSFETGKIYLSNSIKIPLNSLKIIDTENLATIKNSTLINSGDFEIIKLVFKNNKNVYCFRKNNKNVGVLYKTNKEYFNDCTSYIGKKPEIFNNYVCGNSIVSATNYRLLFDKKYNSYLIKKETPHISEYYYHLMDIKKTDKISFIHGETYSTAMNSKYIIVQRNKKYGLFKFDFDNGYHLEKIKPKKLPHGFGYAYDHPANCQFKLKGNEILQIKYDSIRFKNNLVYFYKDTKIGIHPTIKDAIYDDIDANSKLFWRLYKNKKTGWLNINNQKEYWD